MTHVWIAQANGRDHAGRILLVTTDEEIALKAARDHMVRHNGDDRQLVTAANAAKTIEDLRDFVARFDSAWCDAASAYRMEVTEPPPPPPEEHCWFCNALIKKAGRSWRAVEDMTVGHVHPDADSTWHPLNAHQPAKPLAVVEAGSQIGRQMGLTKDRYR